MSSATEVGQWRVLGYVHLADRSGNRRLDDGRVLPGRLHVYRDRRAEVDGEADDGEAVHHRHDGHYQWQHGELILVSIRGPY